MNQQEHSLSNAYSVDIEYITAMLSTNAETGFNTDQITERLAEFGANIIEQKKAESPLIIFINQFKSPFVLLLFVAAGLSFYFKEWLDGIAILIVVLLNAVIGFIMEYQAEKSMESLKRLTSVKAKVFRNGKLQEVASEDLVPGDILFIEAGDIVLADGRLLTISQLEIDESALTGESIPVSKNTRKLTENTTLAERTNMLYKGTFATKGNGKAVITGTGMNTELGKIASMVQNAEQTATPLERKIEQFSKKILWLTVILIVVIFVAGVLDGDNVFTMLQTSIALAVAAIPEGLPIVTTLALAQGMLRMARKNVIVKKLSAVETLGGTTVICTDKTGTLTQNKIEVNSVVTPGSLIELKLDLIRRTANYIGDAIPKNDENYQRIIQIGILCNTAEIVIKDGMLTELGDPLETALLKLAYCENKEIDTYRTTFPKIKEEPFSSETKFMATAHKNAGGFLIAAKGAVEELLSKCTTFYENGTNKQITIADKEELLHTANKLAESGLRVIAMAFKEADTLPERLSEELVLAGFVGMIDPPREDVPAAIAECKSAGVNVIMITGDHPSTAKNIGLKIGLLDSDADQPLNGKEMPDFGLLTDSEKSRWVKTKIFARVSPKQKFDLVSVLQENNHIVGMTGDGVNDAPAIKKADIGIAMGLRGTQVAQEVSDMVLKDDSFSSIVSAIKQGRVIFENIRKFVIYLLSCNLSELCIISFSSIMNLHYALFPLQILYINLVTDVLPALALGVTEGSDTVMKMPPRNTKEPIIDRKHWKALIVYSLVITVCSLGAVMCTHYTVHKTENWNPELCNNILFITLILCQLWHVFNMTQDNNIPFYKSDVFRNKYVWYATAICIVLTIGAYLINPVAKVLSLYRPSTMDFAIMFGFSLLSLLVNQILKRTKFIL